MNFSMHFAIGLAAFSFTLIFIFAALRFFPKWKFLDRPGRYGLSRAPIPYYGGLTLFCGFLLSVFLFVPLDRPLVFVLIALTLLVAVSFLDDRYALSPFLRLFVQIAAGALVVYGGVGIRSITNPFGEAFVLDHISFFFANREFFLLSAIFTILWIVFFMNSMNFLDGVPGLVSGVSFLGAASLFLLSIAKWHVVDQTVVILLSAILAGCALAFFIFDFPPPKILMGDTGSVMLGFLIAVLAIFAGGKIATAFLVMGFPLLDAVFTIVRRIFRGQAPWKGDFFHLHHRLLKAGFSEKQVVLIVCGISLLFGVTALFLRSEQKFFALIFLGIFLLLILFRLFSMNKK